MGKGDKRRPRDISEEEFARKWEEIFGEAPPTPEEQAYRQKKILETWKFDDGAYRTDH